MPGLIPQWHKLPVHTTILGGHESDSGLLVFGDCEISSYRNVPFDNYQSTTPGAREYC
jgi:hypothetical protein